ncbi:MAG: hypothetical protein HGA82_02385 [Anaerolineales bacterium]|nr:hypothetical protein [Anaerolineales bacterium]
MGGTDEQLPGGADRRQVRRRLATPELDLEQAAPLLVPLLSVPQLTHYLLDGENVEGLSHCGV